LARALEMRESGERIVFRKIGEVSNRLVTERTPPSTWLARRAKATCASPSFEPMRTGTLAALPSAIVVLMESTMVKLSIMGWNARLLLLIVERMI